MPTTRYLTLLLAASLTTTTAACGGSDEERSATGAGAATEAAVTADGGSAAASASKSAGTKDDSTTGGASAAKQPAADPKTDPVAAVQGGVPIFDVRTREEWDAGHAKGAIHLPLASLESGTLPAVDPSDALIVYCRSGNRSAQAARILADAGFKNVVDLGPLDAWEQAGGDIVQ